MVSALISPLAFLFPGQGSQKPGMEGNLPSLFPELFEQASEKMGMDVVAFLRSASAEDLARTEITQPMVFLVSYALFLLIRQRGIHPQYACGHSLGEYTALCASGALSFSTALDLVIARGNYMARAVPHHQGGMLALIGFSDEEIDSLLRDYQPDGVVEIANRNSPEQVVLSGNFATLERIYVERTPLLRGSNKKVVLLPVGGPFHSTLMRPAAEAFWASHLCSLKPQPFSFPVLSNYSGDIYPSPEEIPRLLRFQMDHPVLWWKCIQKLKQLGVRTMVEIGPGRILTRMIAPYWKEATFFTINSEKDVEELGENVSPG
ncbi:MAG: ACP S-malonyltransferase [bacterium JZ-2024 1]